jgi:hypothetical protein
VKKIAHQKGRENTLRKIFTFILAAVIATSFSVVSFAQDKPAAGADQPKAGMDQPAKKMEKKSTKKQKKMKKSMKKDEMAPAAEPAPAK